ncbi:MAG: hypothetical protein ACRDH1_08725 [Actinomycetota bacterium]
MNNGRLAVIGLAAALGIGTTAAVLEYRSSASAGSIVELTGDDLQAKPREEGEDDLQVAEDDPGAGEDPNDTTRGGHGTGGATTGGQAGDTTQNDTTRGGHGTGGATTGGQAGDTTQNDTTRGGRGTGGKTTGGPAGDTTQSASGGGGVFIGGGSYSGGGGGSGSGGGT